MIEGSTSNGNGSRTTQEECSTTEEFCKECYAGGKMMNGRREEAGTADGL